MKELFSLFITFARIGAFTFGGGYAMLPMLQREVVESRKWATEDEVLDYFAIGQCTPGVIFVNTATFIGYKRKGIPGAIFATAGGVFPSLVIIMVIAAVLTNFAELPVVQYAFGGIRVVVGVLILNAVAGMWKKSVVDKLGVVLAAIAFLVVTFTGLSPVWMVLMGAVIGILAKSFSAAGKGEA
ncbi:chromate transporter [Anaerotignum lactatifermentans]|uniref:Chromate transporter n=1 Tax=Anaerotignum lactatifermentans TaxID=160404 RepID=A0ABS2GC59_9FIRM|nr:chromate transporter [Anaerotignum lactatifermentans]MBM6830218.1 chromate transporter [Anaerotignum lactatifermentans]MBM6878767.1 chromate transporter [Anaerotignum lactatifermentans]MBM6951831.1 chromate transporter [Anaerotignum lactatifermentans]